MPDVREVQQARASATKLATLVGKAGQWIIEKTTWRPHIMDGTTAGGKALAFKSEVDTKADDNNVIKQSSQTLTETVQTTVLTNLGVIPAIEELTAEYTGTNANANALSVQTMSTTSSDPWSDLN